MTRDTPLAYRLALATGPLLYTLPSPITDAYALRSTPMSQKPTHKDEAYWRKQFTDESPSQCANAGIKRLAEGMEKKPDVLMREDVKRERTAIPTVIEGVVSEIGRQNHGVAVFACAMWREDGDTMVTTSSSHFPDGPSEVHDKPHAASHHFAHFALNNGGIPSTAISKVPRGVPWPDFKMGARPAMPHEVPDWEIEKENLLMWFEKLWTWQGGHRRLQWKTIVNDVNHQRFIYIEQQRLPQEYTDPDEQEVLDDPSHWDERVTRLWLRHVRSTMDPWGRVLPDKTDTAIQFRRVDGLYAKPIHHETFALEPSKNTNLNWSTAELSYESRVMHAIGSAAKKAAEAKKRAEMLYGPARQLVESVEDAVPSYRRLWRKVYAYEAMAPPEARTISGEQARKEGWHPACELVAREPASFSRNFDGAQNHYPPEFIKLTMKGHGRFGTSLLRDWLAEKHLCDTSAGLALGGMNGMAVGFYAIGHTAFNIARYMPDTPERASQMDKSNMKAHTPAEYRVLEQCAKVIEEQIHRSRNALQPKLPVLDIDLAPRYSRWNPERWTERWANGREVPQSDIGLQAPGQNIFDSTWQEFLKGKQSFIYSGLGVPLQNEKLRNKTGANGAVSTDTSTVNTRDTGFEAIIDLASSSASGSSQELEITNVLGSTNDLGACTVSPAEDPVLMRLLGESVGMPAELLRPRISQDIASKRHPPSAQPNKQRSTAIIKRPCVSSVRKDLKESGTDMRFPTTRERESRTSKRKEGPSSDGPALRSSKKVK